ncbi:MAG: hypothetical protein U0R80_01810 [Nocardioidaceae bacterium]
MQRDLGLSAEPWLTIELRADAVVLDGMPVSGDDPLRERYARVLRRVATEVATPLGRQVGATVVDRQGVVAHLAIHPDGTTDDVDALVAAAATAPDPVIRLRAGIPATVAGKRRGPWSRRMAWGLAGALAAGLTAGGVAAIASVAIDARMPEDTRPMARTSPPAVDGTSPAVVVVDDPSSDPTVRLVALGPGRVRVLLAHVSVPGRVVVALDPARGDRVVRRLLAPRGRSSFVVRGLAGGPTAYRVTLPGGERASGSLRVPPVRHDSAPVLPSSPPSSSAPTVPSSTAGAGGGHGGGHGGAQASPEPADVTPIDPDDL